MQLRCCWLPATRRSLQEEDAALAVKVPLPINRLCRVRQWLSEKVAALDAEHAALEGKQMVRPVRMHAARVVATIQAPITCATHAHSCCPVKQQWGAAEDRSQHLPWVLLQALLKAESKLRSQETEASLLDETARNLSTAAAAGAAAALRQAADKHDSEVTAAKRQLMLMASRQQQEQHAMLKQQQEAERRCR